MNELDLVEKWKAEAEKWEVQAGKNLDLANRAVTAVEKMRRWRTACIPLLGFLAAFVPIELVKGCEKDELIETIATDANACHDELKKLKETPAPVCPACPGCQVCPDCPPAPECPAPPACPDPVIVDLGTEWDQRVDRAIAQAQPLRDAYQARMQEFLPVLQRAKDLGVGPRIRDWINNSEAVQTFIEMSVRWGEVEQADNQMRGVLDRVHEQMSELCWWSKQNRQGARLQEMYPDYGLHERVRREMFELSNYHMLNYVCMDEVARQREEASEP